MDKAHSINNRHVVYMRGVKAMLTSVSIQTSALSSDTNFAPVKGEATTQQAPQPAQLEKTASTNNVSSPKQDSVTLSSTARDMSKVLNQKHDQKSEINKEAVKQKDQSASDGSKAYAKAGKNYPPFLGDGEELKILKETSPAMYREVLRMIVPKPLNVSPADLQILKGTQPGSRTAKSESTIA